MIDDIAAIVHRIAQDGAEFAWKSIGDHALALDQAGIAIARLLSRPAAVDQHDVAAALLQVQRHADSYHSRSENDHISGRSHRARFPPCDPESDRPSFLQVLKLA